MTLRSLAVLALLAVPVGAGDKPSTPPVPVFLTTPAAIGGFTDPNKERADSMKDLTEALGSKKNLRLVHKREDARIVVEVMDRGVREDSGTMTRMLGGKNEVKRLNVKVTVGEFSTTLSGESAGGGLGGGPGRGPWKKAAYRVADQIERWVDENQAQLATAALPPPPPPDAPAAPKAEEK